MRRAFELALRHTLPVNPVYAIMRTSEKAYPQILIWLRLRRAKFYEANHPLLGRPARAAPSPKTNNAPTSTQHPPATLKHVARPPGSTTPIDQRPPPSMPLG